MFGKKPSQDVEEWKRLFFNLIYKQLTNLKVLSTEVSRNSFKVSIFISV
jgi:hypothetical protein